MTNHSKLHGHGVRYLRAGHLTLGIVAVAAGLAILPFAFELLALRHLTPTAFGTPMAIEPAIGVLLGVLVLHQTPTAVQIIGSVLVVIAGTAAQHGGRRRPHPELELTG